MCNGVLGGVGTPASLVDAGRPAGRVNCKQTWQEMGREGHEHKLRRKNFISYRQEKPLMTSDRGKAEERGNAPGRVMHEIGGRTRWILWFLPTSGLCADRSTWG